MNSPQTSNSKKTKQYFIQDDMKVYFNSDFDGGNMEKVQQLAPYIYKIYPGYDKDKQSTNKTFFHFKVFGFKMCAVRFHITRVHILEKLLKKNQSDIYRPIYKKGHNAYKRFRGEIQINYNKSDEIQLIFTFQFGQEVTWYQFAFAYPYSYTRSQQLIKNFKQKYSNHQEIYLYDEILSYTAEKRQIKIIHITDRSNCLSEREEDIEGLFPQQCNRSYKLNKPKVIVSARVHPGEAPSSFCLEGLMKFLLNEKDYRAYLLRKNFHFIIVPMLNPDGVYNGHFRTDLNGDNLNRFYENCSKNKHPTIWSFRKYLQELNNQQQRVAFYFDFHAHPSKKQFFIYGNAFNQFTQQVQAQTFGKILEHNCPFFHNVDSIFHEKQMKAKDKLDAHSKQGCGRVYVHRLFNLIHSYTVQCGYFTPGKLHKLSKIQQNSLLPDQYYTDQWQNCNPDYYTPESYMLMGKSIIICILDLFHLNPFTRINDQNKSIANIRKTVSMNIYSNTERFRMTDGLITKKMRDLTQIIEESYYKPRFQEYGLSVSENHHLKFKRKAHSMNARVYLPKSNYHSKQSKLDTQQYNLIYQQAPIKTNNQESRQNLYGPSSARNILSSKEYQDQTNQSLINKQTRQSNRYKSYDKFSKPSKLQSHIQPIEPSTKKQIVHKSQSMRISLFINKQQSKPKQITKQRTNINKVPKELLINLAKQRNILAISGANTYVFPNLKVQNR